jgi:hypothetical protein
MPKKLTTWKKVEAISILVLVLWLAMEIAFDILSLIIHHWVVTLPLSIFLIWWYYFRDGKD